MGSENPQSGSSCHRRTPTQADENSGSGKDRQAHEVLVSSTIQQRTQVNQVLPEMNSF